MNTALPALFTVAAIFAIVVMWQTVKSNWAAINELRRQMAQPHHACDVVVNLRQPLVEFDALAAIRRPRQVRVPAPKPITHRLHQFTKSKLAIG